MHGPVPMPVPNASVGGSRTPPPGAAGPMSLSATALPGVDQSLVGRPLAGETSGGPVASSGLADASRTADTPPPAAVQGGRRPDPVDAPAAAADPAVPVDPQRDRFGPAELALVLSHYDLGTLTRIRDYPRGSRRAPKLLIQNATAPFLLKRRARGKDDLHRVAFCHAVQAHLGARQFPLPRLIGTRDHNNSMVQLNDAAYELFEFIKGTPFDSSREATLEAGKILGLFHKLLRDFETSYPSVKGTYHASRTVAAALNRIPDTIAKTDPSADVSAVTAASQRLHEAYLEAIRTVERAGMNQWPTQVIHTDWHPGNMLFRGTRVVAVIDFDAARYAQRVIDVANGALQFSILGDKKHRAGTPDTWPAHLDEQRFLTFLAGYDSVPEAVLSRAELRAVPALMTQALIAEAALPIATTGKFSRLPGAPFLGMVQRKVDWLTANAERLVRLADG